MFYFTSLNPRSENNKKAASFMARFSFLSLFQSRSMQSPQLKYTRKNNGKQYF